jgi:hypothetical protein
MNYLWNEWKSKFWTYLFGAFLFAAAPWNVGPFWLNVVAIFLVTYVLLVLWQFARACWLTIRKSITNKA